MRRRDFDRRRQEAAANKIHIIIRVWSHAPPFTYLFPQPCSEMQAQQAMWLFFFICTIAFFFGVGYSC
jgi:hypothetical protein